jgi:hypothetical protein
MMMTPSQYTDTERVIVELLVAALTRTEFGKYYPDADVVIRWRRGKVLPVVEINRKVELNKPMPEG